MLQAFLESRFSSCSKDPLFGENDEVLPAYLLNHPQQFEVFCDKVMLEDGGMTAHFSFRRGRLLLDGHLHATQVSALLCLQCAVSDRSRSCTDTAVTVLDVLGALMLLLSLVTPWRVC